MMSEPEPRIDRDASRALRRIETQMRAEGKLDKADAAEGAGIVLMPVVFAVSGAVAWSLKSMKVGGPPQVVLTVMIVLVVRHYSVVG